MRNRLISGLSLAVVLVQSRRQSGSMLTVAHALSQDRDVFALPGDVFSPLMEGCNMLLAEGAAPALSGWDILSRYEALYGYPLRLSEALPVAGQSKEAPERAPAPFVPPVHLDERQATVLTVLHEANAPCDADSLCARTAFPPACLLGVLTQLELFGLIEVQPGGAYRATDRILTKHGV